MKSIQFVFSFRSFWAVRSGLGSGGLLDSVVVRTAAGLPYLPGRSVKGLFRHAVRLGEDAGAFPERTTSMLFGTALDELERTQTNAGDLLFQDAVLPGWDEWAAADIDAPGLVDRLFASFASTAIGANGQVAAHSLRVDEVTIPLNLETEVLGPDRPDGGTAWPAVLTLAAGTIRCAGSRRHRGLGRLDVRRIDA